MTRFGSAATARTHRTSAETPGLGTARRRLQAAVLATALAGSLACGSDPGVPVAGVAVSTSEVALPYPGTAEIEVTWSPTAPLTDPVVFVHLWDRERRLLRTFDHAFPAAWQVGEEVSYKISLWQSVLGPPLPSGNYELAIGVTAGGERPALEILGAEIDAGEYVVARVSVPHPAGVAPRLQFGEGWKPPGVDTDRQVLGGRWLEKAGRLNVQGATEPLDLAITLRIPAAQAMPQMLVLDEGVASPSLEVSSPCAPVTRTVEGFGVHRVVMPLIAEDGGDCPIAIAADFSFLDPATLERLSAHLMRVEWSASPSGSAVSSDPPAEPSEPAATESASG